jgi:hypothetical protein
VKGRNGHLISGTNAIVPEQVEEEYRFSVKVVSVQTEV